MMDIETIYKEYTYLEDCRAVLYYKGPFIYSVISEMSQFIRTNLEASNDVRERVFYIFVEMTQNIAHYSSNFYSVNQGRKKVGNGITAIYETEDDFTLITGNLANPEEIQRLFERCDKINALDRKGLRKFKSVLRSEGIVSKHKSGNIGLVDIALKSGEPLRYSSIIIDENICFFTLNVKVKKI